MSTSSSRINHLITFLVVSLCCITIGIGVTAAKVNSAAAASVSAPSTSSAFSLLTSILPTLTLLLFITILTISLYFYLRPSSSIGVVPLLPIEQTNALHSDKTDTDIVIVGAGVAGASLGAALAMRGHRVIVLEQSLTEPHRIVGELLQPSGCQLLRSIGLADALDDTAGAQAVRGYGIFDSKAGDFELSYPTDPQTKQVMEGRSFHNGRFLGALRRQLLKAGKVNTRAELRQGKVASLVEDKTTGRVTGVNYIATNEATGEVTQHTLTSALTIVCDGLMSAFRPMIISNGTQQRSSFLGLIVEITKSQYPSPLGGHVFLADPTPILLYPISPNEARMLVDFPLNTMPKTKDEQKKYLLDKVLPQLHKPIQAAFQAAVESGASLQSMPNMQLCARPQFRAGVLTLGDAMNVRHPLTGGGMTVAFTDVAAIVKAFSTINDFNDTTALDSLVRTHYQTRSGPVAAINILADALYDVFGQKYSSLRSACYDYLGQGGEMSAGPIRLLSGVSRSQTLLVCHFFSVALWGVWKTLYPCPTLAGMKKSYLMLRDANIIILPLLLQEHPGVVCRSIATVLRWIFWIPYLSYVMPPKVPLAP